MTINYCPDYLVKQVLHTPRNQLLLMLPTSEYQVIAPALECVMLPLAEIIALPEDKIEYIYFPIQAMISLVANMQNGATTEISLVGNEGLVGLPAILNDGIMSHQAIVQVGGLALRIRADIFMAEFAQSQPLQKLIFRYVLARLVQVSQCAACNTQHKIEQRLCRWLLSVQDCILSDELPLTQEFIANMLGVRRSGVTVALGYLQKAELIQNRRGLVKILNRTGLEASACECYQMIKTESMRLLGISRG